MSIKPKIVLTSPLQESLLAPGEDNNNYHYKFRQNEKTVYKRLFVFTMEFSFEMNLDLWVRILTNRVPDKRHMGQIYLMYLEYLKLYIWVRLWAVGSKFQWKWNSWYQLVHTSMAIPVAYGWSQWLWHIFLIVCYKFLNILNSLADSTHQNMWDAANRVKKRL